LSTDREPRQKIFGLRVPFTRGLSRKLFLLVQNPLERVLLLDRLNRVYAQVTQRKDGSPFLDRVLLLVDLRKCDRKILEHYMGEDGSATCLNYHEGQPARDLAL